MRITRFGAARFRPLDSGEYTADVRVSCEDQAEGKFLKGCVVDSGCSAGIAVHSISELPSDFRPDDKCEEAQLANGLHVQCPSGQVRLQIAGTSTSAEVKATVLGGSQNLLGCESWRYPGYTVALYPTGACAMIEPGNCEFPVCRGRIIAPAIYSALWGTGGHVCTLTVSLGSLSRHTSASEIQLMIRPMFTVLDSRNSDETIEFSLTCQVRIIRCWEIE